EIRPSQAVAERQPAHRQPRPGAQRDGKRQRQPRVQAQAELPQRLPVCTHAKEQRMSERQLPAIATQNIPCLREQRGVQRHHDERQGHTRLHHRGGNRHGHTEQQHGIQVFHDQARAPNKPCGRNSSTRIKMAKMPICPNVSPHSSPPTDSTTPTSSPPASAPAKLPMPPSTTMVKATSTKPLPTCGLT